MAITRQLPPVKHYVAPHVDLPVIAEVKRAERRRNRVTYGLLFTLGGFLLGFIAGVVMMVL